MKCKCQFIFNKKQHEIKVKVLYKTSQKQILRCSRSGISLRVNKVQIVLRFYYLTLCFWLSSLSSSQSFTSTSPTEARFIINLKLPLLCLRSASSEDCSQQLWWFSCLVQSYFHRAAVFPAECLRDMITHIEVHSYSRNVTFISVCSFSSVCPCFLLLFFLLNTPCLSLSLSRSLFAGGRVESG